MKKQQAKKTCVIFSTISPTNTHYFVFVLCIIHAPMNNSNRILNRILYKG
jgi:uncharacterized membrane protein YpjA